MDKRSKKTRTVFAFDLDGTVTREETLPILAGELGLSEEMARLTRLTMDGHFAFSESFRLRFHILKEIPLATIQGIMDTVELDPVIADFIRARAEDCAIVTGNLDLWVEPILKKLGCRAFTSKSAWNEQEELVLASIVDKGASVRALRREADRVIAVGEGANDIPMFEAADIAVSYGGVHRPVEAAIAASDYMARDADSLCGLLLMLSNQQER
ncbi:MAG: HAD family phosphatase [Schwartzia sp.]|nr:HAD family phosphatase [Schwartzia sp. (in: firmicutes)]